MAGEMNFGLLNTNAPAEAALAPVKGMGAVNALISQDLQNQASQFEMQNALAEQQAYKQAGGDVAAAQKNLMGAGLGKQSIAIGQAQAKTNLDQMKALSERLPMQREMAKSMALDPSPRNIMANLDYQVKMGWVTPQQAQSTLQNLQGKSPEELTAYFTNSATKAEDFAKYLEDVRSNKVREGQAQQQIGISAGHLNLAQREFATKQAEKGPEGQVLKDIQSNTKALKTAGYDPTTGEDKVSDLIKQSTSGMGQALGAATVGALGGTTSGMKAIGQLDTISKTMTLDLLNNKLGAGISNADRDALEARFGSIANPNLPADQRLAAWTEAKEIMRKAAMLPEVKKEAKSAGKPITGEIDFSNLK